MSSETRAKTPIWLIETDVMDRDAFEAACRRVHGLSALIDSGGRLSPGFPFLARDFFAIFFKHNVVWLRSDVRPADRFNRQLLSWLLGTPQLSAHRSTTRLDTLRAGFFTKRALEAVVNLLKTPTWFDGDDLVRQWEMDQLQHQLSEVESQLSSIEDLPSSSDALEKLQTDLAEAHSELSTRLDQLDRAQQQDMARLPAAAQLRVTEAAAGASELADTSEAAAENYGTGLGLGGSQLHAADKLALGERLLASPKLQQLSRLAGLFKEVARAARKRRLSRRPSEVHSIGVGADLEHVLSSELVSLRHKLLRRDFMRRYVDGLLQQYSVRGMDRAGRGPMVVCIDASGSMKGQREVWSKAICLTLLEIARTQRRAFRAIPFSSQRAELREFHLLESALDRRLRRPTIPLQEILAFADYFPGGGTNFELPLAAALAALEESRFRQGDIVFITDGAANVSGPFLEHLRSQKAALGFRVFGVHIDLHNESPRHLEAFADEIISVRELTAEALKPVFRKL